MTAYFCYHNDSESESKSYQVAIRNKVLYHAQAHDKNLLGIFRIPIMELILLNSTHRDLHPESQTTC